MQGAGAHRGDHRAPAPAAPQPVQGGAVDLGGRALGGQGDRVGLFDTLEGAPPLTSDELARRGPGLGTLWGEELACAMLEEAGFRALRRKRLPHDFMNVYYIARRPD